MQAVRKLGHVARDFKFPWNFDHCDRPGAGRSQKLFLREHVFKPNAALQSERSICWLPIATVQGCCLLSQTERLGPSKSGSANIPMATAIRSGRCSASQKTVPPHSGQK